MRRKYFPFNFLIWFIVSNLISQMVNGQKSKFRPSERFSDDALSVSDTFDDFKKKYNDVDLQLGMPDFIPPTFIRNNLLNVSLSDDLSAYLYPDAEGITELRKIIARIYSGLINRPLDPNKNVIVTVGSTEALYLTFQTHTHPGDEWIVFEPLYFMYPRLIKAGGGVPKYIRLRPTKSHGNISSSDWIFDKKELATLFNRNTKGIVINTPHNPTGKVFTQEELQFVADLAVKWDTLIVTDEVYEWLLFDSNKHVRIASLPDVYERTISITSASKTFSVTGWRVGWAYGPADLLSNLKRLQKVAVYSLTSTTQLAVAETLKDTLIKNGSFSSYLTSFSRQLQFKRDYLIDALRKIGITPTVPEAGYYITADWTTLNYPISLKDEHDKYADHRFTKWLAKQSGVRFMPLTVMYGSDNRYSGEKYVRICIAKKNETIHKVVDLLLTWFSRRSEN